VGSAWALGCLAARLHGDRMKLRALAWVRCFVRPPNGSSCRHLHIVLCFRRRPAYTHTHTCIHAPPAAMRDENSDPAGASGGPSAAEAGPTVPPLLSFSFVEGPVSGTELSSSGFSLTIGRTRKSKLHIKDTSGWWHGHAWAHGHAWTCVGARATTKGYACVPHTQCQRCNRSWRTHTHTHKHAPSLFHTHTQTHAHAQCPRHTRSCRDTHANTHTRARSVRVTRAGVVEWRSVGAA
jgi:hypothetical protein